jgi:hypothetical protein
MLTSGTGRLPLVVERTFPVVLGLNPFGILGRHALGRPTLSARIGERCHHGHRSHEGKEHHGRR